MVPPGVRRRDDRARGEGGLCLCRLYDRRWTSEAMRGELKGQLMTFYEPPHHTTLSDLSNNGAILSDWTPTGREHNGSLCFCIFTYIYIYIYLYILYIVISSYEMLWLTKGLKKNTGCCVLHGIPSVLRSLN